MSRVIYVTAVGKELMPIQDQCILKLNSVSTAEKWNHYDCIWIPVYLVKTSSLLSLIFLSLPDIFFANKIFLFVTFRLLVQFSKLPNHMICFFLVHERMYLLHHSCTNRPLWPIVTCWCIRHYKQIQTSMVSFSLFLSALLLQPKH